jgi:hypothetical protein
MLRLLSRIFFSLSFLLISLNVSSQITDDFTDGNFSSAPAWIGNDTDFTVNGSMQLQLNSSGTDTSFLSTTNSQSINNAEWNFWIRLNFSASASNNARVYLVSDQQNLQSALNGYYLQFGEALSGDQVELFRQSGTVSSSVCRGTTLIANAFIIRVKVTRDAAGLWTLFIDSSGGTNYTQEAQGTDNTFTTTNFFGINCFYTSSNATKFYFDDFYIGPIIVDVTSPLVDSVKIISANQLDVHFNEAVSLTTSQLNTNYIVNNGVGVPTFAARDVNDISLVHLTFATNFPQNITNLLQVTSVEDLNSNVINPNNNTPFVFYSPALFDVVINEIMADPDPPLLLPNFEYVELFNRKNFPIKLVNWTITVGSNTKILPDVTIPADSFIVLTSTTGAPNFTGINVAAVVSFPALTNTGQIIILRDSFGQVMHTISYSDNWYADASKEDGGWSLEMIDPNNPCAAENNWRASVNASGGTPGKRNSVRAANLDNTSPQLLRVGVIASYDTIVAYFTEPLDSTTLLSTTNFSIDNGIGNPIAVNPIEPDFKSVKLILPVQLSNGIIYTLTVTNLIEDCAGNAVSVSNTALFAIPQPCQINDVVINEILPDPKDNGVDFVEIYNRSSKVIDLKELYLCTMDTITNTLADIKIISANGYLFFPGNYLVLSTNSNAVRMQYTTTNPKGFLDMTSLPSMNIDGDVVVLINQSQTIIDKLIYFGNWHFPLLNNTKGVSLERINYDRSTQDKTNWHSAAENVGYATPAYKNSQYSTGENSSEITIQPEVFSPDNDGYNDVVNISYNFSSSGYIANITIYDNKGRLERTLVRNELIGANGTFSWDGVNDKNEKSKIGIYIIYFEVFDSEGNVRKIKKTCVLATKL